MLKNLHQQPAVLKHKRKVVQHRELPAVEKQRKKKKKNSCFANNKEARKASFFLPFIGRVRMNLYFEPRSISKE